MKPPTGPSTVVTDDRKYFRTICYVVLCTAINLLICRIPLNLFVGTISIKIMFWIDFYVISRSERVLKASRVNNDFKTDMEFFDLR